ncbi:MAG: hypothetical protein AB8H80_03120 [Planctomycetota bacterium]
MERGLLSDTKLAPSYDKAVWMYLFQNFSKSEADRRAERVAIRFGITAWPQHFLVDPVTLKGIGDTGRSLASFERALADAAATLAKAEPNRPGITPKQLAARDAQAEKLEEQASLEDAKRCVMHEDVVVRYRAIERLRDEAPQALAAAAKDLLAVPHDQTRFLVCKALAANPNSSAHSGPAVADSLEALIRDPSGSKNPNLLRSYAVMALAPRGDASSVAIVAPHATSGLYLNMLTKESVTCLVKIAARDADAKPLVLEQLPQALPRPAPDASERDRKACDRLAQRVHKGLEQLTGKRIAFPASYDAESHAALVESWRRTCRAIGR